MEESHSSNSYLINSFSTRTRINNRAHRYFDRDNSLAVISVQYLRKALSSLRRENGRTGRKEHAHSQLTPKDSIDFSSYAVCNTNVYTISTLRRGLAIPFILSFQPNRTVGHCPGLYSVDRFREIPAYSNTPEKPNGKRNATNPKPPFPLRRWYKFYNFHSSSSTTPLVSAARIKYNTRSSGHALVKMYSLSELASSRCHNSSHCFNLPKIPRRARSS
jgi:hypothetical protein